MCVEGVGERGREFPTTKRKNNKLKTTLIRFQFITKAVLGAADLRSARTTPSAALVGAAASPPQRPAEWVAGWLTTAG